MDAALPGGRAGVGSLPRRADSELFQNDDVGGGGPVSAILPRAGHQGGLGEEAGVGSGAAPVNRALFYSCFSSTYAVSYGYSCSCGKGCYTTCYATAYASTQYCYCSAGQYSAPYGYVLSTSSCSYCLGGYYQSSYGATSCLACPAVSRADFSSLQTTCSTLFAIIFRVDVAVYFQGYYCPSGSTTYSACPGVSRASFSSVQSTLF